MKKIFFFFIITSNIFGQESLDYNNSNNSIIICKGIQESLKEFSSNKEAQDALKKITSTVAMSNSIILSACDEINNALAITIDGDRYIFYDKNFMKIISENTNAWSNLVILAHEVGHHINNHTRDLYLNDKPSDKSTLQQFEDSKLDELEADYFAGFVLGKLGASLNEAKEGISLISSDDENRYSTHPSKSRRIAKIEEGWRKATEVSTTFKGNKATNNTSKILLTTAVRCSANTKEGIRCKNKTKNSSGKCWRHE